MKWNKSKILISGSSCTPIYLFDFGIRYVLELIYNFLRDFLCMVFPEEIPKFLSKFLPVENFLQKYVYILLRTVHVLFCTLFTAGRVYRILLGLEKSDFLFTGSCRTFLYGNTCRKCGLRSSLTYTFCILKWFYVFVFVLLLYKVQIQFVIFTMPKCMYEEPKAV